MWTEYEEPAIHKSAFSNVNLPGCVATCQVNRFYFLIQKASGCSASFYNHSLFHSDRPLTMLTVFVFKLIFHRVRAFSSTMEYLESQHSSPASVVPTQSMVNNTTLNGVLIYVAFAMTQSCYQLPHSVFVFLFLLTLTQT